MLHDTRVLHETRDDALCAAEAGHQRAVRARGALPGQPQLRAVPPGGEEQDVRQ